MKTRFKNKLCAVLLSAALLSALYACSSPVTAQPQTAATVIMATEDIVLPGAVVTLKTKDGVRMETALPVLNFGFQTDADVSAQAKKLSDDALAEVQATAREMRVQMADGSGSTDEVFGESMPTDEHPYFFRSYFDYTYNGGISSLCMNFQTFTGGAHGADWKHCINVDAVTGESISLPQLFKDPAAANAVIEKKILDEMKGKGFDGIDLILKEKNDEYSYYIDGSKLVVYFDAYEIAPGAAGIPEFYFDLSKMETVRTFDANRSDAVYRRNGVPDARVTPIFGETILLPVAGTGIETESRRLEDGSWKTDGTTVQSVIIDGQEYLTLDFFTQSLGAFMVYDGKVIRAYTP